MAELITHTDTSSSNQNKLLMIEFLRFDHPLWRDTREGQIALVFPGKVRIVYVQPLLDFMILSQGVFYFQILITEAIHRMDSRSHIHNTEVRFNKINKQDRGVCLLQHLDSAYDEALYTIIYIWYHHEYSLRTIDVKLSYGRQNIFVRSVYLHRALYMSGRSWDCIYYIHTIIPRTLMWLWTEPGFVDRENEGHIEGKLPLFLSSNIAEQQLWFRA